MRIFVDESGSFQVPAAREEHAAAVVVGVVVPEICEERLFAEFKQLSVSLAPSERKGAEPKGARLKSDSRLQFCDILASIEGLLVLPITADLSQLADLTNAFPARLSSSLDAFAKRCVHQTMRDEMSLLARQVANLSTTDLLKLVLYADCMQECVHHAVAYRSHGPYRDSWATMDIVIDQIGKDAGRREKLVFEKMVLAWLTAWSVRRPLMMIKEIHTSDHPFVKRFEQEDGINMRSLYGDAIRWEDSASELGLQIADIAAAIVFDAVHDLANQRDRWEAFLSLMRCCPLAARMVLDS